MEGLTCDEFLEKTIQGKADLLDRILFSQDDVHNDMLKDFEKYTKLLLRSKKTNNYGAVTRFTETSRFKDILAPTKESDAGKENKMNATNNDLIVKVKTEKLSISSQSVCDDTANMPAPKMPPRKTKRVKKEKVSNVLKVNQESRSETEDSAGSKRVTRSKVGRSSDVILQKPVIPIVDLRESLEKEEEVPVRSTRTRTKKKAETAPIRSTRTRTKKTEPTKEDEEETKPTSRVTRTKTRTKRDRSESENENGVLAQKRSKSSSSVPDEEPTTDNVSTHTEYEDAVSHLDNKANETFVIKHCAANKTPNAGKEVEASLLRMNQTVVLEKSKSHLTTVNNTNDMFTDDESIEEQVVVSPQKKAKQDNLKQVFSPYSPVKKKVEAFEKFQNNENVTTWKMNTSKILKEIEENRGNVKEKAKGFTGSTSILRSNPPSASKVGKYIGQKTSMLNNSRIGTPLSGRDFKERELRRLEKEREQKKREMLKQAMSEERKKKHDEKVQRIQQQQKEAKEKELEKALQIQRMKDERVKMILQQKEEKHRLMREENERKRLLAKQRAEEKRKEEEAQKLAMQERKEQKRKMEGDSSKNSSAENLPIYLTQPTPVLSCVDCYDSDDERSHTVKDNLPAWASKSRVRAQDYMQTEAGHRVKNTLFCCQSQNIDLREVFKRIHPEKLKRTSSAHWDKPPRFTLLPPLED